MENLWTPIEQSGQKGRTQAEANQIISWLTGYSEAEIENCRTASLCYGDFFLKAPRPNPARLLVTGTICGVRVERIENPIMRDIRCLDKLIDELAKGRPMEKILQG